MRSFPTWIESSGPPSSNSRAPLLPDVSPPAFLTFHVRPESEPVEGMIERFVRHSTWLEEIRK